MLVEIINICLRLKRNHIFPVCLIILILVCVIQLDFGMNRTGRSRFCNISINDWFNHFSALFKTRFENERGDRDNTNPLLNAILNNITTPQKEAFELNSPITEQEIKQSIKNLKNNKAAGADGVVSEMFKFAGNCLIPYIHSLFNKIFDTGVYPVLWSNSTIIPIHKKGSVNVTDNYRGICLSSIFSKKFTRILNVRLQKWVDDNKLISEEQAGFHRGYSTVDNAFILNSFVQKYLGKRRKVYVAFIDYRKAFYSVNRSVLWKLLCKNGIIGKMLVIFQGIYEDVRCNVRCDKGETDFFQSLSGLEQGCILSPLLFSYLIQVVANEVRLKGGHGLQSHPDVSELLFLLFTDAIVLISDTVQGLQRKIIILLQISELLGLNVHTGKSKVVVFRNGGHLAAHEKWLINNTPLKVEVEYTYLGIVFSTR